MKEINGKVYPLWQQFLDQREEWIGGVLHDSEEQPTYIEDVFLEPNGTDSATFGFRGREYICSFDVRYGGVGGNAPKNGIGFSTAYSSFYVIKRRKDERKDSSIIEGSEA